MGKQVDIEAFLTRHRLPLGYGQQIKQYLIPLAQACVRIQPKGRGLFIGINGVQGAGKSTVADFLVGWFKSKYQLNAVAISIDDFYLDRARRQALADEVHPLFATRGVPGTHDIALMESTLTALIEGRTGVPIPRFNKAEDEPFEPSLWRRNQAPLDVVILEGWCVGSRAQPAAMLETAVNRLEREQDPDGVWRRCVNSALANEYARIFERLDYLIQFQAPGFKPVLQWRLQQEQKLIAQYGVTQHTMDAEGIGEFIMHFQRISEYNLACERTDADACLLLNEERKITALHIHPSQIAPADCLLFTATQGTITQGTGASGKLPALLAELEQAGVPVIFNTAKTAAELGPLRQTLENRHPFIVENGAAVYIPLDYFPVMPRGGQRIGSYLRYVFGPSRTVLQQVIAKLSPYYGEHFDCFSALGIRGIQNVTGLSEQQAQLAQRRTYSEPLFWHGPENELFLFRQAVENLGFKVLVDGHLVYITRHCDKGKTMEWLIRQYETQCGRSFSSIAIGSACSDAEMLRSADTAWVVADSRRRLPKLPPGSALYCVNSGVNGWCEAVRGSHVLQPLFEKAVKQDCRV